MLRKTGIQAMYINRIRDLQKVNAEYENLIDRRSLGEDVEDELGENIAEGSKLDTEISILRQILGDDVPEVHKP